MKANMFLTTVMAMSMLLAGVNANAQRRDRERERTEYRKHNDDRKYRRNHDRDNRFDRNDKRGGYYKYGYAPHPKYRPKMHPKGHKMVRCTPPRIRRGSYVPGWEGRVRYHNDGRWGYYVGGVWTYYDCYYDPYEFFCEPIPLRPVRPTSVVHVHHNNAGEVAAGIVAGTVIGCIIGGLAH